MNWFDELRQVSWLMGAWIASAALVVGMLWLLFARPRRQLRGPKDPRPSA